MEQERIGKFILEVRKQKGLTQKELAEKIGVSDKTISKWECGNSIPDTTYLESLCNSLDISVNELLSGQCLSGESYSEKAEENIMALMKENEINKKGDFGQKVLGIACCCASIICLCVMCWGMDGIVTLVRFYDFPTLLVYAILCIGCILLSGTKTKLEKLAFLQKVSIPNGALVSLIQVVFILMKLDDISVLGPSVAVSLLVLLYSVVVYLVGTILRVRCEKE